MGILLDSHLRYIANPVNRDAAMQEVVRLMEQVARVEGRQAAQGQGQPVDHFSAGGPLLLTQHGMLLPWARGHLSAAATRILAITEVEAQIGAIFDIREVGGVVRGREVPASLQQWLLQRVAHIHRAGPGNQPGIVLALLYRLDAARVRELTLGGRARLAAGMGAGRRPG